MSFRVPHRFRLQGFHSGLRAVRKLAAGWTIFLVFACCNSIVDKEIETRADHMANGEAKGNGVDDVKKVECKKETADKPNFCNNGEMADSSASPLVRRYTRQKELLDYLFCSGEIVKFTAVVIEITKGHVMETFPQGNDGEGEDAVVLRITCPEEHENRELIVNFNKPLAPDSPWRTLGRTVTFSLPERAIGNRIEFSNEIVLIRVTDEDLGQLQMKGE